MQGVGNREYGVENDSGRGLATPYSLLPTPCSLALALFVLGVLADDANDAAAVDDLALVTDLLY
jgi:hypothetical protein